MADTSKYTAGAFITLASLGDEVRHETIIEVTMGQYDKYNLTFKSGAKFAVNKSNARTLQKHYGMDYDDRLNKKVKLVAGERQSKGRWTRASASS